jgi:hypothetical protein
VPNLSLLAETPTTAMVFKDIKINNGFSSIDHVPTPLKDEKNGPATRLEKTNG